jgi:hypothetical protein
LTGGGTITLQGNNGSRISGVGGSTTLTIANQTIQGRGQLGQNSIGIVNQAGGLIHANSSGNTLTVDPSSSANMVNQGIMRASTGGELILAGIGGGSFSGGGTYEALNGSQLRGDSLAVVSSVSGGVISEGTWRAIDSGGGAAIRLQNNSIAPVNVIGSNASVELSGANSAFTFNAVSNPIDNSLNNVQGDLNLHNGRVMNLVGNLTNSGDIHLVGATTALNTPVGNYNQTGGSLILAQGATFSSSNGQATNGLIAGIGTINGNFTFDSSAVISPGASPGTLVFGNNLTWGAGGSIQFDLGSNAAASDLIAVTGNLLKAGSGTHAFTFIDNGWQSGQTYDLVTFNSTNFNLNDFSYTNGDGFVGTFGYGGGGSTLQLTVSAVPEPSAFVLIPSAMVALGINRRRRRN